MCGQTHAGLGPRNRTEAPPTQKPGACVHCGAPADGIDAAVEAPACRPCATGRSDDSRVPYDGPAVQCDRCGRGLEIVVWRDGQPRAGHCRACDRHWSAWNGFFDRTGVDRDDVLVADGAGDGGIRVVCRDCGLERIWYPSDDRRKHKHERVTNHEVAYEAADELARPDRGVDLRTDGGRELGPAEATAVLEEMSELAERQTDAIERVADELRYQNAVLSEVVRTLDDVAGDDRTVRTASAVHTAIDDHRVTRDVGESDRR
jgi:hypothetical protein